MNFEHVSVMLMPTVDMLNVREDGIYVDGTLGGGGHSAEILRRLNGTGHLYGIDRDNDALAAATERLGAAGNFTAVKGNFHDVKALLAVARRDENRRHDDRPRREQLSAGYRRARFFLPCGRAAGYAHGSGSGADGA